MVAHTPIGIEVLTGRIEERCGIRGEHARREALADEAALAVASVRVEPVTDDPAAVALDVGHDRHEAGRHFREVDVGIANGRRDWLGDFANIDDTQRHDLSLLTERALRGLYDPVTFDVPRQGSAAAWRVLTVRIRRR